jgi:hypothetical protein
MISITQKNWFSKKFGIFTHRLDQRISLLGVKVTLYVKLMARLSPVSSKAKGGALSSHGEANFEAIALYKK